MSRKRVGPWGSAALLCIAIAATSILVLDSRTAAAGFVAAAVACFLGSTVDWAYLILRGLNKAAMVTVSAEEAYSISDADLPVYTVLLPIFNRPDVDGVLLDRLRSIDYPAEKLDIYLIVAADDEATLTALEGQDLTGVKLVVAPAGMSRTKANACKYALALPGERGDYVTVFGAEEIPDPLQLRQAAYAFSNAAENVAVFQCRLGYYNERQNLLTRWGSMERDRWFSFVLPALSRINCVVPLGGSSSHIRKSLLHEIGGWNTSNATEEAETGIRFARNGYRTLILDSYTVTKATASLRNWSRRRSRWYLGYLQTLGKHARHPIKFYRELGMIPIIRLIHLTAGWQAWCVANIVLWTVFSAWYVSHLGPWNSTLPPAFYLPCVLFIAGNVIALLTGVLTIGASGKPQLLWAALLVPLYWLMQAVEAVVTVLNFVRIWLMSIWPSRTRAQSDHS